MFTFYNVMTGILKLPEILEKCQKYINLNLVLKIRDLF